MTRLHTSRDAGFSLVEMMVATLVLMLVCGTVMTGVLDLTNLSMTVTNRTDMHNGVRLAVDELNKGGFKIKGKPVTLEVIAVDDRADAAAAVYEASARCSTITPLGRPVEPEV